MWPKALDHVMHCNADGVHGRKIVIDHAGKQSLRAAELTAQKHHNILGRERQPESLLLPSFLWSPRIGWRKVDPRAAARGFRLPLPYPCRVPKSLTVQLENFFEVQQWLYEYPLLVRTSGPLPYWASGINICIVFNTAS